MKIAFNPSTVAALITPPNNKDITFDLRGRNIFARGVKFCGTDTWRDIKINNVSIGSNILDLRNGSNTTLTNTNGVVTINSTWRPVVDNLTSDSTTSSLSAKQGKVLKSLIDGKSNSGHSHDDRYLKLTGGTMAGNALITFADSGSLGTDKGPQGARGGLYWTGQSDYAKLYAEETAGDNLDLVIQFGDDNSNGLSIRNKANTQTSYISAGGVITTGTFKGNLDWSYITNKPATATRWPSWAEVTEKPSSFTPSTHTHGLSNSVFFLNMPSISGNAKWKEVFGYPVNYNLLLSVRINSPAPEWCVGNYGSGILYGGSDTKGFMSSAYNEPLIMWAGGNGSSDDSVPKWYIGIKGIHKSIYNLATIASEANAAYNLRHSHANKSVLDGITFALVNNWNTAYNFVSTITGEDTDKVINKWDEIVNFLAGITEDNKLNTLLNSKLSVYELANNTNVGAIKNNGIYYSTSDASSGTLTNSPFNTGFALINMTSFDNGDDLRRSRLAFNAYGEIKVSDDRDLANTAETWYNVLTSKNSGISGSTIKLNGTSITVYSSSTADGRYVKKSGDTMSGALNFANNTWNKVGDDVYMGDHNIGGLLCIMGANGTTGLSFHKYDDASIRKSITFDGNTLYMNGSCDYATLSNLTNLLAINTVPNKTTSTSIGSWSPISGRYVFHQKWTDTSTGSDSADFGIYLDGNLTANMVLDGYYNSLLGFRVIGATGGFLKANGTIDNSTYLTSHLSLSNYYTKSEVDTKLNSKLNYRLFWERTNIDLNSITEAWHTYEVNNGTGTSNTPTNASWHQAVLWGTGDTNYAVLLCTAYTSNYSLYLRHKIAGKWYNWIQLAATTDIPTSLKNPHALTISLNGTSQGPYDGSAAKNINITPSSIGAATSGHNHDKRYVYNYGDTQMDANSLNKNALGISSNSGIGGWWCILQAAWNNEYRWNSLIAFPTQNRNGMYYRSGLDNNTAWGDWVKLLDVNNSYVNSGKGYINATEITLVNNASNATNSINSNRLSSNAEFALGNNFLLYFNTAGLRSSGVNNAAPDKDWWHIIRMNHPNSKGYFSELAIALNSYNGVYWRTISYGREAKSWTRLANIEDLAWDNITGKPSSFTPSAHTHTVFKNNLMIKGTNGISDSASIHLGIGDSDTGFKWISDGKCLIYANNVAVGEWTSGGMNWFKNPTVNGNKVWNAGNDGSGSGLDADLLDGWHLDSIRKNAGYSWSTKYRINNWSRIIKIDNYSNILLAINFSQNSQASNHLYLISTGYGCGNIVQLGANGYSSNSAIKIRLTENTATSHNVEIYSTYGYNGATELSINCNYTRIDGNSTITTYLTYTAGEGTVKKEIISSYNKIVANLQGNSDTTTKLQTPRQINGTNFDGSANITTSYWGATRTLTIGNSGKSVNGSANISWSLSEIGAAPSSHNHNYAANENYGGFIKSGRLPISGFYQSAESESGGNAPWSNWMHLINCLHSNTGNNYALLIAASFFNNNTFKIRVTNNNVNNAWRDIIHSGNIGSQTVANAYHLRINSANTWSTWNWSELSGLPSWLWGSNDGTNMYVWNPSNFRVAYASSAGNADTVDGVHANQLCRIYTFGVNNSIIKVGTLTSGQSGHVCKLRFNSGIGHNAENQDKTMTVVIRASNGYANSNGFYFEAHSESYRGGAFTTFYLHLTSKTQCELYMAAFSWSGQSTYEISFSNGDSWTNEISVQNALPTSNIFTLSNHQIAYTDYNVASATKLATARTIWGQSFDGTADVSGFMKNVRGLIYGGTLGEDWSDGNNTHPWYGIDYRHCVDSAETGKAYTSISSYFGLYFKTGGCRFIFDGGNVGIGTTTPAYKLHVAGDIYTTTGFKKNGSSDSYVLLGGGGHKLESALSVANADTVDGYHENSFLRYRGNTRTDLEATLWNLIGIKEYYNALPDGLTNIYNWGSVISLPGSSSRFEIYASHISSSGNGLYYRSGCESDKKTWLKFIDSSNIGSQSVNYANSAGNADTLDGIHANGLLTALSNSNNGISITVGGTTKSVSDINVNGANTILGTSPQIAASTEANSIYVSSPDYSTNKPVKMLCFDWYSNYWALSNIRSGNTHSAGFGVFFKNTEIARFTSDGNLSCNAASATKLQTPRTIWGQSFDGTENVSGFMKNVRGLIYGGTLGENWSDGNNTHPWYGIDYRHCVDSAETGKAYTSISSYFGLYFKTGGSRFIFDGGDVGIGTASPIEKLDVHGNIISNNIRIYGNEVTNNSKGLFIQASDKTNRAFLTYNGNVENSSYLNICSTYGNIVLSPFINVGIGTNTPTHKLHVEGNIYSNGGFYKNGSNNEYVLLGGGGHQTISSLSVNYASSAGTATIADSAHKLNKWFDSRVTTLNHLFGDGALRIFHATSSVTDTTKCPSDATILHLAWDNNEGWDSLLAVGPSHNTLYFRGLNKHKWNLWQTVLHNGNSSISGNTIKINNTSLTVANSNHNHDNVYLKLSGGTMLDLSRIGVNGNLYIGDVDNNGWLYFQDIASLDGALYWSISTDGSAVFEDISIRSDVNVEGLIYRDGISSSWNKGRDNALLRDTSANGYHPLWSLKTTNGSWDFGEYNQTDWNNIPVLSYITDTQYNGSSPTYTYQIKFPLASGTVALTSNIPNPTDYYWANVKISSTDNIMTLPLFYSVKAYQYSLTNANGSGSYNLAYLYNNIINIGSNSLIMHINASNILFYANSTQCIDINTQGHIGIGKTASLSAYLTVTSITELTTLKLLVDGAFRLQPVCVACGKVIDPISSTNLDVYSSLNITATYIKNHYRINLDNLKSSMLSQNNVYAQITPITKYVSYRTEAIKDGSYIYLDVYCNARTSFYFCVWAY